LSEKDAAVPKLKTRKSAAKRFKITGTGKVLRPKGFGNKKRLAKSPRTKRMYDEFFEAPSAIAKTVKRMLPYGAS
jgi:large subunit ribosomal protein L35